MEKLPPFTPAAEGYFHPGSPIRLVNSELVGAFSGGRALLLQAAHPVMFEGFYQSSSIQQDIHGRLARTARIMTIIYFGSREDADRWTAVVRKMHSNIRGELQEDAGFFIAGTPYAADDPKYLLWTLATLWDSAELFFERYVRELTDAERWGLWQDYRVVGGLFGLQDDEMPQDVFEARSYMDSMVNGWELFVTEKARQAGRSVVLHPPAPMWMSPLVQAVNFAVVGSLPKKIRKGYGFHWPVGADQLRQIGAVSTRANLKVLPDALTKSPAAGGKLLSLS